MIYCVGPPPFPRKSCFALISGVPKTKVVHVYNTRITNMSGKSHKLDKRHVDVSIYRGPHLDPEYLDPPSMLYISSMRAPSMRAYTRA